MELLDALLPREALRERLNALACFLEVSVRLLDAQGDTLSWFGGEREDAAGCAYCGYCALVREKALRKGECDRAYAGAGRVAAKLGESYIFTCPAELTNIAFALVGKKLPLGMVLIGPFLMDAPDSALLSAFAEKSRLPPSLCLDAYDEARRLPVISPKRVRALAQLAGHVLSPLLSDERLFMQQRREMLRQQARIGETIQLYKGMQTSGSSAFIYEKENELLNRVRQGDIASSRALLNELLGYVLLVEGQNMALIRARALELTILLSRVAIEGGAPAERILRINPQYLSQLQEAAGFEDVCYLMQEIVVNFVRDISLPDADAIPPAVRRAVAYIAAHYDQPLTIRVMADVLGISPSYFSALFSRHMGAGFQSHLTRVRVEEARRLLSATDFPIDQIAAAVGYADQSSFAKAFKRLTGVTPRQAR